MTDPRVADRLGPAELLTLGACLVAPLNLLLFRSLTVYDVLIALAMADLCLRRRLVMPDRRYLAASYVFLFAALLSSFRATYSIEAITQVWQYVFIFYVQIPVVLSVVRTRRRAVVCVALLCVGTLLAVLHSFLFRPTQGAGRVVVFYSENPNRLGYPAAYLLVLLLVLWYLSRGLPKPARMWVGAACAFGGYLAVWAVFASGSRSSLVGAVAALVVYLALRPGNGVLGAAQRTVAVAVVGGALGWGLIASGQMPDTLSERVTRSVGSTADREDQAHLVGDREQLVDAGLLAFADSPFLGTGLDNFRYVTTDYNLFATPQLPHNLWLQLLVQVGLFGTAAFACYLVLWFRDLRLAYLHASEPDRRLLWGLAASMAGVLVIFMFAPEMLDRHYWLILALGLAVRSGVEASVPARSLPVVSTR